MAFQLEPVGVVRTTRDDPGDSDHWGSVVSDIEIDDRFGDDCLHGVAGLLARRGRVRLRPRR
jgi:tRNA (Thr-GGU) A37 N-methylase